MSQPSFLSSLMSRTDRIAALVGPATHEEWMRRWLEVELGRCDDPSWTQNFESHFVLPGVKQADFANRIVRAGESAVLGGIRFSGGDTNRPFVNLLAWTGYPCWPQVLGSVAQAWAVFSPHQVRVLTQVSPESVASVVDQTVHLAPLATVAGTTEPLKSPLSLLPITDAGEAAAFVAGCYEQFHTDSPHLRTEALPADSDQIRSCMTEGAADWIVVDGRRVGVVATMPGEIDFVRGHVVVEEVLDREFKGRGLGRHIQHAAARRLLERFSPGELLIGTIHRDNESSRRTAERAGRKEQLAYRWMPIPPGHAE
jgi:GNAT superfamily N-acetyltransferase